MAAQPYGLIATFETAPDLYHAAENVRDAGYRFWDCITPFPVHGLDKAMGLKRSIVPRISLGGGIGRDAEDPRMRHRIDAGIADDEIEAAGEDAADRHADEQVEGRSEEATPALQS